MAPEYSFVLPIYNELETLPELERRLAAVMDRMDGSCEAILVDDGSRDGSWPLMRRLPERDARFRVIRLSRNFGHQLALTAGLDHARGQAAIIMDGDLQDPPELALDLAARWREGFDVVYAVREERAGEKLSKRLTARWFYRVLNRLSEVKIPLDAGDFRLVDRRVLTAMGSMREHRRYLRGMFAWVGFDQTGVTYVRDGRAAGETKFSLKKMINFATDGIVSFSAVPLRLTLNIGFAVSVLTFVAGVLAIVFKLTGVYTVPGWASIVFGVAFLGGMQLTVLGVVGEYIARIYDEVKHRPLYLVSEELGDGDGGAGAAAAVAELERPR